MGIKLVAFDGSETSRKALNQAAGLLREGDELLVLMVVPVAAIAEFADVPPDISTAKAHGIVNAAVAELRDRGIHLAANAVAQSKDHILSFFQMLRTELAFYLGCMNLHDRLVQIGTQVCFPLSADPGGWKHTFTGLYDVCLALTQMSVVANDLNADNRHLVVITGANQGGKSTFLRGIGIAQLMMQAGMFVGAGHFCANISNGIFTHYKREEDATMKSGKLDEELKRMSEIVNMVTPSSLLLLNESFASTNEREGSEVARQVIYTLLESGIKVFFVTHLYKFAQDSCDHKTEGLLFLRAGRQVDGERNFKILEGEPLKTSFGEDLYKNIFDDALFRRERERA